MSQLEDFEFLEKKLRRIVKDQNDLKDQFDQFKETLVALARRDQKNDEYGKLEAAKCDEKVYRYGLEWDELDDEVTELQDKRMKSPPHLPALTAAYWSILDVQRHLRADYGVHSLMLVTLSNNIRMNLTNWKPFIDKTTSNCETTMQQLGDTSKKLEEIGKALAAKRIQLCAKHGQIT